jgi:hypothetical protein
VRNIFYLPALSRCAYDQLRMKWLSPKHTFIRASEIAFLGVRITVVLAPGILAAWVMFASYPPSSAPVSASITLVDYTNITMLYPDTNVYVYPGRGEWLRAHMRLKNEGSVSISYGAWGGEPYGWANAQTDQGPTNGYLAPRFTGGTAVLSPGSSAMFWVMLPTNTSRWQCGFSVQRASMREYAFSKFFQTRVSRLLPPLCWFPLRWLPDRPGPLVEVKSGSLEVDGAGGSSPNNVRSPAR